MPGPFVRRERVRYGDLDVTHRLAHVQCLQFFESARIAYLRELRPGRSTADPDRGPHGVIFASCHVDYRAPAFYDEELATTCSIGEVRRSSFRIDFAMHVADRLVAEGHGWLVAFDYERQAPMPLADELRETLTA